MSVDLGRLNPDQRRAMDSTTIRNLERDLRGANEHCIALVKEREAAHEALYSAHAFIESVTHWDGQQDDQEEVLAEISEVLPPKVQALPDERNLTDG